MASECPCCGGAIGNPLAGAGIHVTSDSSPEEGSFIACTTCTIYEDFTPVDPERKAAIERERVRLGLEAAPAADAGATFDCIVCAHDALACPVHAGGREGPPDA